ncbi:hypothetical protein UFOVP594_24 [uncultured Caudovirales phage]|uniref:Uncharacterized protein n=1 Tax=uncultured Caudovirales phage TaxID=2100421 RepID=A0A6J5MYU0_9CAUD|nr:hypothetical protein UFOVP594_24 [uncultured Caudovirales phage]
MKKLFDNLSVQATLDPKTHTTDTTGSDYIDTQGYRDGMLVAVSGTIGTTTADTYTVTLKECDTTAGSYTSTGISLAFTASEDNTVKLARIPELNLTRMRYLRADLTCSATTISWIGTVALVLGEADHGPIN